MHEHASDLPLHGGLVEIARRMAETPDRLRRFATFEPVRGGGARCPECHLRGVTKPSNLQAMEDDDPANSRRYACEVCDQKYRVGV